MLKYKWEMSGDSRLGPNGQSWMCAGELETKTQGEFMTLPDRALKDAFQLLTEGRAVYGHPGLGCVGPYRIRKLVIEEITSS